MGQLVSENLTWPIVVQMGQLLSKNLTWPVVVQMGQLVSENLHLVGRKLAFIKDHVVTCGIHRTLPNINMFNFRLAR